MGQYHYICSMDRHEYLHPHAFGDGLKLMEFGPSPYGTMLGLALLLAASNGPTGRGGGDWHPWLGGPGYEGREVDADPDRAALLAEHIPGRWAGNRVAVIGDYYEPADVMGLTDRGDTPWDESRGWVDISPIVVEAIELDYYTREERKKHYDYGTLYNEPPELHEDGIITAGVHVDA